MGGTQQATRERAGSRRGGRGERVGCIAGAWRDARASDMSMGQKKSPALGGTPSTGSRGGLGCQTDAHRRGWNDACGFVRAECELVFVLPQPS